MELITRRSFQLGRVLLVSAVFFCGFLAGLPAVWCKRRHYVYHIQEAPYTRLCQTKNILTVNGQFPGPTIYARRGDTLVVEVYNHAEVNVTLHWHGVKQPRNPWSDGPEYITQCPIQPSANFTYNVVLSDEEGTIWWHAHSDWTRATVHGAIVVYPPAEHNGTYPFLKPHQEVVVIIGEWWKSDVMEVLDEMLATGAAPNVSDAFTINGQPGHLYACSEEDMFRMTVKRGKRYLLRLVNAAMNDETFFAVARHPLTVVGADGSYTKPFTTDYVMISPGQSMDLLLETTQPSSDALYYMAAKAYSSSSVVGYDNTTTTAVLQYAAAVNSTSTITYFPSLPPFNSTDAVANFTNGLKSLSSEDHPIAVPRSIDRRLLITVSINQFPCGNSSCEGPNNTRLAASLNNISFVPPAIDVLGAYYRSIGGVFRKGFPNRPPLSFNFTGDDLPSSLTVPRNDTKVKVLEYNRSVEIVFQGTNLVAALNHPMHLHGYSFYVVGQGPGNFDKKRDPRGYNLEDPPLLNTYGVPRNGWAAIRFRTDNPGVWFMHCHFERHVIWGMETVLIVKNGEKPEAQMLPPPPYMPPC